MTYLARWRLELGARLLQTTRHSVLEVAAQVGYESEAAFNRAFKRQSRPTARALSSRAPRTVPSGFEEKGLLTRGLGRWGRTTS